MHFRQLIMAAVMAVAALFLTGVQFAEAARAIVTQSVNIRSGPGPEYRVVGRADRGDRVNVTRCTRSQRWCHIEQRRGRDGWVSSRFLSHRGGGGGGGHWSGGGHGGGHGGGGHGRPGGVCFYGAHGYICLNP